MSPLEYDELSFVREELATPDPDVDAAILELEFFKTDLALGRAVDPRRLLEAVEVIAADAAAVREAWAACDAAWEKIEKEREKVVRKAARKVADAAESLKRGRMTKDERWDVGTALEDVAEDLLEEFP